MTPPGVPLDANLFLKAQVSSVKVGKTGRSGDAQAVSYNVDKVTMAQDLSLISVEEVLKGRLAAAKALAALMVHGAEVVSPRSLTVVSCFSSVGGIMIAADLADVALTCVISALFLALSCHSPDLPDLLCSATPRLPGLNSCPSDRTCLRHR